MMMVMMMMVMMILIATMMIMMIMIMTMIMTMIMIVMEMMIFIKLNAFILTSRTHQYEYLHQTGLTNGRWRLLFLLEYRRIYYDNSKKM